MNCTVLAFAFAVAGLLAMGLGALDAAVGVGPLAALLAGLAVMLLASLIDRDGFYGPRER